MIETFLLGLAAGVGPWLYLVTGALVLAETALLVGFLVPGETALLVAGAASHLGTLNLGATVALAVVAAVLGDLVGFVIGRRWGATIRSSRVGRWIGPRRWEAVDRALARRGGSAVLLGRLTAFLRAVTPFAAGSSGMTYRTFLPWNVAGAVVWGSGAVLLGWLFEGALATVGRYLTWGPVAVVVVLAAVGLVRHRRHHRITA